MLLVMLLVPVTAVAQETTTGAIPEGIVVAAPTLGSGVLLLADSAAQAQTPAARADAGTRRRPSMVGYVEDSTISTQFRVRFDSMRHIHEPDRAEFFYGKCGCYRGLPPSLSIYDPDAPGNDGGILIDANSQQLFIQGEVGMMQNRGSLFVELPVRWLKPQEFAVGSFEDQTGISDLRLGAKFGLMATDSGQATVLLRVGVPTGDAEKGLGTDHASIEPALLVAQRVGDRVGLELQVGGVFPAGGSAGLPTAGSDKFAGRVLYYGIGPSFDVYSSDTVRFSPVIELVGWRLMSGFQTGNPAETSGPAAGFAEAKDVSPNIVNIKIGARVVIGDMASIYVGYGHHLTDATWYDDIFRIEYRVGVGR
ncbi:MAG: hypothetical protein A3H97_17830 [Acidobacteria bacterium RIFCSPLOWO2_02_FULL_65_29]|nr:MAG: hypothetical protein A3H97_17830 [Acidobacteria bacterium RIFCSPLOWO2_02_FULL_65_29]